MASGLLRHLRWPLWIAELFTGAKSFADNPLIGSRRLNRLGLHRLRLRAAAGMTAWRRRRLANGVSAADREDFAQRGFVRWDGVLPPDAFERLRSGLLERVWPCREMIQGNVVTRRIVVDPEMLRLVPDLAALIASPRWRGLLRYVAATRAEPHYYIQTILTYRGEAEDDPHRADADGDPQNAIHADTFHSTMKAWLFLTDVELEDGPLSYVTGSHQLTEARLEWEQQCALRAPEGLDPLSARGSLRIAVPELDGLGLEPPLPFDVPANTLIVADTLGFHARSPAARPSVRVELWAYVRRNPFLPWTGLNIGNLPGLRHRRISVLWRLQERFPRLLGPLPFIAAKRPAEP